MILTTEYRGTATSLTSPHYQLAQASMNAIRLSEWRDRLQSSSGTGRASSDAADYARPSGRAVFLESALAAFLVAVICFGITAWHQVHNAPPIQQEVRTFERPIASETYTRTQIDWGATKGSD